MNARTAILRYLKKTGLILAIFVFVYGMAAFLLPIISVNSDAKPTVDEVFVFVKTNGVHADIVVPIKNEIKDWTQDIKLENTTGKDANVTYVAFGWGNKEFYLNTPRWSDLKYSTAFNAAFGLGESAIHATFIKGLKESENCIRLGISKANYKKLIAYIEDSLERDGNYNTVFIPATTYGTNDSFYEAKGSYTMFNTCNTWVNNALKSAHQKAALWTVTDSGIFYHYKGKYCQKHY